MTQPPLPSLDSYSVLGMRVDGTSYQDATARVLQWAQAGESRYVCVANVHMTMEAYDDPAYRAVVNGADLVTPDGMPLVWTLRAMGAAHQPRVYGPDLTLHLCEAAAQHHVSVGFYGGQPHVLEQMKEKLQRRYPALSIVYCYSPPFRPLTEEEDQQVIDDIHASGARIVFVGLGCPKQERWMHEHRQRLRAVMLGVGAAFDFHAGHVRQAPGWLQGAGLEWLFRLTMEPRRLWKRYARHNPRFVWHIAQQLRRGAPPPPPRPDPPTTP